GARRLDLLRSGHARLAEPRTADRELDLGGDRRADRLRARRRVLSGGPVRRGEAVALRIRRRRGPGGAPRRPQACPERARRGPSLRWAPSSRAWRTWGATGAGEPFLR